MKALIFDPYLDTLGGGEVYSSSLAQCLVARGWDVDLLWSDERILSKINRYLGIDISSCKINVYGYWLFTRKGNLVNKWRFSRKYDFFFMVSDGSLPWMFAKKNYLHFQVPFNTKRHISPISRIKLLRIHHVVCNSQFTKNVIDKNYFTHAEVVYPPINIAVSEYKKENIILSVGRFTTSLHQKRQDILIDAFKKVVDRGAKGWSLRLVGNASESESKAMVKDLKTQAQGYPIEFLVNVNHQVLEREYAKAKLFWHAAGYDIDQVRFPELVEHFGLASAEAMSAGCVPILVNKGGQPEIIYPTKTGFLFESIEELVAISTDLISDPSKIKDIGERAKKSALRFKKEVFCKNFQSLLHSNGE